MVDFFTYAVVAGLYLLPAIIALARKRGSRFSITALNVLLGWTLIGWIAALIWAIWGRPWDPTHKNAFAQVKERFEQADKLYKDRLAAEDRADEANGLLIARGVSGKMAFNGQDVTITRGRGKDGIVGERSIAVGAITTVQLTPYHLQLIFPGTLEAEAGSLDAIFDENSMNFNPEQRPAFERMATAIRTAIAERGKGVVMAPSDADELAKFAELHDRGVLTDEEFAIKKAKLLD